MLVFAVSDSRHRHFAGGAEKTVPAVRAGERNGVTPLRRHGSRACGGEAACAGHGRLARGRQQAETRLDLHAVDPGCAGEEERAKRKRRVAPARRGEGAEPEHPVRRGQSVWPRDPQHHPCRIRPSHGFRRLGRGGGGSGRARQLRSGADGHHAHRHRRAGGDQAHPHAARARRAHSGDRDFGARLRGGSQARLRRRHERLSGQAGDARGARRSDGADREAADQQITARNCAGCAGCPTIRRCPGHCGRAECLRQRCQRCSPRPRN